MLSFLFKSPCHFILFLFENICISMQKNHTNFVSTEQLIASPSPLQCPCHTMWQDNLCVHPSLPSALLHPQCPTTAQWNFDNCYNKKLLKTKPLQNQNCSQFLSPHHRQDTLQLDRVWRKQSDDSNSRVDWFVIFLKGTEKLSSTLLWSTKNEWELLTISFILIQNSKLPVFFKRSLLTAYHSL